MDITVSMVKNCSWAWDAPQPVSSKKIGIRKKEIQVTDKTKRFTFKTVLDISDDEAEVLLAGGQLRYIKKQIQA